MNPLKALADGLEVFRRAATGLGLYTEQLNANTKNFKIPSFFSAITFFFCNEVKFKGAKTVPCGAPAQFFSNGLWNRTGAPQGTVLAPMIFTSKR